MKVKYLSQLRSRTLFEMAMSGSNSVPGLIYLQTPQTEKVQTGHYQFYPYLSLSYWNGGGQTPLCLFLVPESYRTAGQFEKPLHFYNGPAQNGANYVSPLGRDWPGVSLGLGCEVASATSNAQGQWNGIDFGISRGIYVPYGYFLRGAALANAYGPMRMEYLYVEVPECEDVE